jgi:hypothetical protein
MGNGMKKLLIQCATGTDYTAELQATWPLHNAYASAHGFDFWHFQGWQGAIGWARFRLIELGCVAGYDFVVWLDSDAVIVDNTADLADALPEGGNIGAMYYGYDDVPSDQPHHYNVGVLYVHNTHPTRFFLNDLVTYEPEPYKPWPAWWVDPNSEQRVFNDFVNEVRWQTIPYRVEERWNVIYGHEHGVMPVVLHLAGQNGTQRRALLDGIVRHQTAKVTA